MAEGGFLSSSTARRRGRCLAPDVNGSIPEHLTLLAAAVIMNPMRDESTSEDVRACLTRTLIKEEPILAAFLFGSAACAKAGPLSDVDVALLLDTSVPEPAYPDVRVELGLKLSKALGKECDVVVLNEAPPFLRYEVLSSGSCLLDRNPAATKSFTAKSILDYLDFLPHKRFLEGRALARLKAASRG